MTAAGAATPATGADDRPRVLLVDDSEVVRRGLALVLESVLGMDVVECSAAEEAVARAALGDVDVALVDARMPGRDGIWALARMREQQPDAPVVIISTFDTAEYVQAALEGGAAGYILKEATTQQLKDALETALGRRGVYLHPVVAAGVIRQARPSSNGAPDRLTPREQDVLDLLSGGETNEDIANRLFLAEKTVKTHLSSIFRKLHVSNRTQAATKALREGLVSRAGGTA